MMIFVTLILAAGAVYGLIYLMLSMRYEQNFSG
jgi:hypothetical protein